MTSLITSSKTTTSSIPEFRSSVSGCPKVPAAKDPEIVWKRYLQSTTERMGGVDPTVAQVICLGDIHTQPWQTQWRGALLDHYGSPGDVLLCEGYPALKPFDQSKDPRFTAQKKFVCYGCEDMDKLTQHRDVIAAMSELCDKYGELEITSKWSKKDKATWAEITKLDDALNLLRTQKMVETGRKCLELLKPGQKVFLIAGSDHFYYKFGSGAGYLKLNAVELFGKAKVSMVLPREISSTPVEDQKKYIKKFMTQG